MILGGIVFSGIVRAIIGAAKGSDAQRTAEFRARHWVEERMVALIHEFPHWTDWDVTQCVRDEVINLRGDNTHLRWVTVETAARLRRTIMLDMERRRRIGQ